MIIIYTTFMLLFAFIQLEKKSFMYIIIITIYISICIIIVRKNASIFMYDYYFNLY